ncbi:MAG: ABC transporter substrate-binding protein, partial [Paracoccus sp. (in: a-proteobacteria)]|nr:ABC transporter substrate-binding protein [Paracoccus sp. (in: a-proteobacteria)]
WWSGSENDVGPAGAGADGYKALTFHGVGRDYPLYDDMQKYVFDAGKASGAGDQMGSVLYSRGLYAALVISEAIRTAQELSGTDVVNAAQVRDGFEALNITAERMEELGLPGFGQAIQLSCQDHGGDGLVKVQQWSASDRQWSLITDFIEPDAEVLNPLIEADSAAFAQESGIAMRCN